MTATALRAMKIVLVSIVVVHASRVSVLGSCSRSVPVSRFAVPSSSSTFPVRRREQCAEQNPEPEHEPRSANMEV